MKESNNIEFTECCNDKRK